ncbi:MAG: DUF5996 family protein [Cyclobacteriaceae bacterium]|nr:DUF5996 family protein [Cyclobacteriaceae bacterium]
MKIDKNWPILDFNILGDTLETLHQWIQIVGKIRLKTMPWQNHSWHTTLYITANGFSTQSIPYQGRIFQIDFDFINHKLLIICSNKHQESMDLYPRSVASFYTELFKKLRIVGIDVEIHQAPNELESAIPFKQNEINKSYNKEAVESLWLALLKSNEAFTKFRSNFIGKTSPVHLFWGGFDLALTRFSGKEAPLHTGNTPNMPKKVMQEAYSHEVSSVGFWPGSKAFPRPAFYAYCYPTPKAFSAQTARPKQAYYDNDMDEFFLNYEDVQKSDNPEKMVSDFLESTYKAAAVSGNWDRANLEHHP